MDVQAYLSRNSGTFSINDAEDHFGTWAGIEVNGATVFSEITGILTTGETGDVTAELIAAAGNACGAGTELRLTGGRVITGISLTSGSVTAIVDSSVD